MFFILTCFLVFVTKILLSELMAALKRIDGVTDVIMGLEHYADYVKLFLPTNYYLNYFKKG